jgi:multidrug resistance efflux pump
MLNIKENTMTESRLIKKFHSFSLIKDFRARVILVRLLVGLSLLLIIILFLPWTQNVQSRGTVTSMNPGMRPQTIQSIIGGRIEKWYVQEGDFVSKGDTVLYLSEIKGEYFDPKIVQRAEQQINAKEQSATAYTDKIYALENQISALVSTSKLKIKQARNYIVQTKLKVQSDSINLMAAETDYSLAQKQYERMEQLHKDGLKSLTDLEIKKLKSQETLAKKIGAENKLLTSKNEFINTVIELTSIQNQYDEKISKSKSDKYASFSDMYTTEADIAKLQTQSTNYSLRKGMYYITAPQDGYITKAIRTGIGENVKEGEDLISIMPSNYELAVELYIDPVNAPLIEKNQHIRIIFDGWPNIVFSGWPNSSYGTYGGKVVAIDNFVIENGKYRILVIKDKKDYPWPKELRVGAGAFGMALLKDVPIWYEIWRQLSGFPPDYYKSSMQNKAKKNK